MFSHIEIVKMINFKCCFAQQINTKYLLSTADKYVFYFINYSPSGLYSTLTNVSVISIKTKNNTTPNAEP